MEIVENAIALGKDTVAYALILLVGGIIGQFIVTSRRLKGERQLAQISADEALKRHNNEISIQLLEQLRKELARSIRETARLEPFYNRARMLARHLSAVLSADDEQARKIAEGLARAYLESIGGLD